MDIKILRAGDEDVLSHVAIDVFDDPIDLQSTKRFLADPCHHLAVAVDEGTVVGFVSGVHYLHPDKSAPELFINEVGVASSYQGQGIAKKLLSVLFQAGQVVGCLQAWVLTERTNSAAMKLYAAVGGEEAPEDPVMFSFSLNTANVVPKT